MSDKKVHEESGDVLMKMEGFWKKNQKLIIIAVTALVVGVGGWFGYQNMVVAPKETLAAHFHNTYDRAIPNLMVAFS